LIEVQNRQSVDMNVSWYLDHETSLVVSAEKTQRLRWFKLTWKIFKVRAYPTAKPIQAGDTPSTANNKL
jgi:hypothetical protein